MFSPAVPPKMKSVVDKMTGSSEAQTIEHLVRTIHELSAEVERLKAVVGSMRVDEISLKTGHAKLTLKRDGEVMIEGTRITLKSSGDVILKGSRILQN
jgi:hypothetical protein